MENSEWLVSEWMLRFADVMQTMAETKPQMRSTVVAGLPQETLLWWKQPFSCSVGSPLRIGAREQSWTAIGQAVLTSAGVEEPPPAEIRDTYLEIVRQSMGGLADGIGARITVDVTCGEGSETTVEPWPGLIFEVANDVTESPRIVFYLIADEGLFTAVSVPVSSETPVATAAATPSETIPRQSASDYPTNGAGSRTFELLLDVELPISVSFGRARMRINEAMNLISGSLIELDRALSDPVELLVNNAVIARGEVVVVEGNYGIRLTEIVSHKERLQQGRRQMLG